VNRRAQGALLLVAGGAVLRVGLTDVYLRYVRAGLRPFLLVTGVVLIVAAVATFWYEFRGGKPREHHHEPRVAWLLLLPVLALIVVVPPALGSYAASRAGTALQAPPGFPALPPGDPLRMTVLDYATRAVFDHGRSLAGRRITITGFVTLGDNGQPLLTRMVLNCCAADAQPVKVGLTGRVPPDLRPDTWLDVVGTYTDRQARDAVNGAPIPFIDITEAITVPAPPDQYEN
jgi:putative membrane protein